MANVNVNRSVDDVFYRYKMPRIIAKVEGKGNGIKTVIVNMPEVAKALSRPPTYPTKYFGCELGAQTQFDTKNDRYIVNGSHDSSRLQELLDGFIKRFVLCPECENPETNLTVHQKKGIIIQSCIACGHRNDIDMRHKLTTFILRNPPDQDPSAATPSKKDRKEKKKEGKGKSKGAETVNGSSDSHQDSKTKRHSSKEEEEDNEDWGEDTSEAAVQKRMQELSSVAKIMTISEDCEKTPQERVDLFYGFVKSRKETQQLTGIEKEKIIVTEAERLDIKDKASMVLAELLYDASILSQIKIFRTLFLRFTAQNHKSQKYLLGAFEQLVGNVHASSLMTKVPHILKTFYDNDILDEEVILDWDAKHSKKYVSKEVSKEIHNMASPFIKWLQSAEEESSEDEDEDDDDEDVEVVYSHTGKTGTQTIPKEKPAKVQEEEYDDLNIDAI